MVSDDTLHFERAEKLAKDPERVRRNFWAKLKRVARSLDGAARVRTVRSARSHAPRGNAARSGSPGNRSTLAAAPRSAS